MSVRSRGNKCYTRRNKNGGAYVVCNDPPIGSRGQAGVYQAENPTGKQDGRSKRKAKERDKQRALNRVRKAIATEHYQSNFGGGQGITKQRVPKNAPAKSTMTRDLIDKGSNPEDLQGMGKLFIYTRWANETDEGKRFIERNELKKPKKFGSVNDRDNIKDMAEAILDGEAGELTDGKFKPKGIDKFPIRAEYDEYEEGELDAEEREELEERTIRYKHYLELAGRKVPDWVKDISR